MKDSELKVLVKKSYGDIAKKGGSCCPSKGSCCGVKPAEAISKNIGYTDEDLKAVPSGANLGLGCGNPIAMASIKEGETVFDLGSGAGFDSFLAAGKVGLSGRVIGVDMTPEMIETARENAAKGNYSNVEFRLGELENLPVADGSVDVVIFCFYCRSGIHRNRPLPAVPPFHWYFRRNRFYFRPTSLSLCTISDFSRHSFYKKAIVSLLQGFIVSFSKKSLLIIHIS